MIRMGSNDNITTGNKRRGGRGEQVEQEGSKRREQRRKYALLEEDWGSNIVSILSFKFRHFKWQRTRQEWKWKFTKKGKCSRSETGEQNGQQVVFEHPIWSNTVCFYSWGGFWVRKSTLVQKTRVLLLFDCCQAWPTALLIPVRLEHVTIHVLLVGGW